MNWHFRRKEPGQELTEPTQAEFFHQDAIRGILQPIVREGIQNALDARRENSTSPVQIRIAIKSGTRHACSQESVAELFPADMWQHIEADKNGLNPDLIPNKTEGCGYLVFEDFGTTGLSGDIRQHARQNGKGSNFFNFFRATGVTDKEGNSLGKWGIGKHTFWMASRINTIFGFSVREPQNADDPAHVLIGKTILKSHAINGESEAAYQGGLYGIVQKNGLVLPFSGKEEISKFKSDFDLQRDNQPGLSLVVPWPVETIQEITMQQFIDCIVQDYFYPIVANQLDVTVEINNDKQVINADSINEVANSGIKKLIELASSIKNDGDKMYTITPNSLPKPEWEKGMFDQEILDKLCESFNHQKKILIRAELGIRHKNNTRHKKSHFDIAFVQDNNSAGTGQPCFIRQGIIIPDVRGGRIAKNITALVVSEDAPLADFLGASENPSHTQWQQNLLTDKYNNVAKILDFVRFSVQKIVEVITQADENRDYGLLSNIFPMPQSGADDPDTDTPDVPPAKPQPFIIKPIEGGFSLKNNSQNPIPIGSHLAIEVAYGIRGGNPFAKYDINDFVISELPIKCVGIDVVTSAENTMKITTTDEKFSLEIQGFDNNRDVEVNARIEEQNDS